MSGHRPERVAEMVHRELAERLRSEIKDPRVGPVSITAVQVSRDLSRAVISFLPLGGTGPDPELAEGLREAAKKLRGPIGRALRLRHAPELVFEYDTRTEGAFRVMNVLDRLAAERRDPGVASDVDDADDGSSEEGEE
ncbi:MAG: 30S ribosome-binding factor RbfA [Alphaproteobacteria bacterium]|nr:30S ribosome-binding factor RbfA [Alphaproteobacteria bacterium]MCB9696459.1 30S ribosome-binding factor RbfA [Alphaproteobacteria bacterium]